VTEEQPHEHVWDSTFQDTHERCYCGATEPRFAPEDITFFRATEPAEDPAPMPTFKAGDEVIFTSKRGTWRFVVEDPQPDDEQTLKDIGDVVVTTTGRVRPTTPPEGVERVTGL
jgi:hypothetical protein